MERSKSPNRGKSRSRSRSRSRSKSPKKTKIVKKLSPQKIKPKSPPRYNLYAPLRQRSPAKGEGRSYSSGRPQFMENLYPSQRRQISRRN